MKENILVLVRATPELSKGHGHLVCVAGINEDNQWRRLYPFKFSYKEKLIDFRKKDNIEVFLTDPDNDRRKESRRVANHKNLNSHLIDEEIRDRIQPLVSSIEKLNIENASLGVIKPELLDVEIIINSTNIYDNQAYFSLTGDYLEKRENNSEKLNEFLKYC